jgi:hypothetical protein
MKERSSTLPPGGAQPGDLEPAPLPPPPPSPFDDDEEPAWWTTLRPPPRPVELPRLPPMRRRARTADDEVCATAHVLRVRARLGPAERRAFDELMRGPSATDIVTMLVNRSEDDAVEKLRRRLDDEPTLAELSRRSLALRIGALAGLLSMDERIRALASLSGLWPEELIALNARLAELPAPEAAALIRTYLGARR